MRFITYHGPNRDPRPGSNRGFRIDVQLASNGQTLILTRRDEKVIDDSTRFKGYGHNFEKATTEQAAPFLATTHNRTHISRLSSTGHHRITRFDLLGLRFLVRYEVDAMIPPTEAQAEKTDDDELDVLSKALAQASISDAEPTVETKPKPKFMPIPKKPETIVEVTGSDLRHIVHGQLIPQAQVLELRTIKSVFEVPWSDVYPQLFLSQTPVIKVAKQLDGRIDSIQTFTKDSQDMKTAHTNLAPDFVALSTVLSRIRDVAQKHKLMGRPLAVFWSGQGDLKIRIVYQDSHLLSEKDLGKF